VSGVCSWRSARISVWYELRRFSELAVCVGCFSEMFFLFWCHIRVLSLSVRSLPCGSRMHKGRAVLCSCLLREACLRVYFQTLRLLFIVQFPRDSERISLISSCICCVCFLQLYTLDVTELCRDDV
jgi:hypothetical protein